MSGPYAPALGHRFDLEKILLDPYAKAISSKNYRRNAAAKSGDNAAFAAKSVVADLSAYDWEGDRPLDHPFSSSVLYELHVGGFTWNPNSGVTEQKRGTYAGLIEKIPYLKDLGITAVELMPVFQFDAQDAPAGLENYWGYSPMSFFAPHGGYSSRPHPLGCLDEFRDMVKALHQAGIEVILDVVYNHTAEAGVGGPTFSFKGLDNRFYYLLSDDLSQVRGLYRHRQYAQQQLRGRPPNDRRQSSILGFRDACGWLPLRSCRGPDPGRIRSASPRRSHPLGH